MKKAIIVVIIIGALVALYFVNNRTTEVENTPDTASQGDTFQPDPSNATFTFDEGPVTLSEGKSERPVGDSQYLTEEVSLTKYVAYGDLNEDKKNDAAVIIARSGGGSGFFIYIAPFLSNSGSYKGGNAIFLGDRIAPQNISISNGVVNVEYLDRRDDEPFAAEATVPTTKQFVVRKGILEEK